MRIRRPNLHLRWLWILPVRLAWTWPRRGAQAALRGVGWFLLAVWQKRDFVLGKIEYAHGESAKFRALFTALKLPYTGLRACGLNPQAAIALLALGGTAGGGVIVNETILSERSFGRGDSGVYSAPMDIPTSYSDSNNTLKIDLGVTPVGEITISGVTVGTAFTGSTLPSGQSKVIIVGGTAASSGFTATWLEVGHLIINRWRCTNFSMSDVEAHTLNIRYNASDGQSISPVAGTPRARGIGGGNRADSMITSGGTYDQIIIGAPTSAVNGKVDVLRLSNIYTKGGPCVLSRIKAGTIDIEFMETGAGNGFASKEFVVSTSTVYKIANITDNVEVSISPP